MPHHTCRRHGFSLRELTIVLACTAFLAGHPWFSRNLLEAQHCKVNQDLDRLEKAIALYDARESRPHHGTDLDLFEGIYLQEVPQDPWGNEYLFDGTAGVLCSYGLDGLPGGTGADKDHIRFTHEPLHIRRAQYQGRWGRPTLANRTAGSVDWSTGNKFLVTFNKPVWIQPGTKGVDGIALLDGTYESTDRGDRYRPLSDPALGGGIPAFRDGSDAPRPDPMHRPDHRVLVAYATADFRQNSAASAITPTMALDLTQEAVGTAEPDSGTFRETFVRSRHSPLDPVTYGRAATSRLRRPAQVVEREGASEKNRERRRMGVRLEKY